MQTLRDKCQRNEEQKSKEEQDWKKKERDREGTRIGRRGKGTRKREMQTTRINVHIKTV